MCTIPQTLSRARGVRRRGWARDLFVIVILNGSVYTLVTQILTGSYLFNNTNSVACFKLLLQRYKQRTYPEILQEHGLPFYTVHAQRVKGQTELLGTDKD